MSDSIKLDLNNYDHFANFRNPLEDLMRDAQRKQLQQIAAAEAIRREKENEERRRHEEIIEALRNASGSITIGDNATGIQIQQNSSHSTQKMNIETGFDYEKVTSVMKEIQDYTEYPQFAKTYGGNSENVKQLVEEILCAANKKQEPSLIQKSLRTLKELTIGTGGSLIASGILALLENLPL